MNNIMAEPVTERLLTPAEVAALFRVEPRTVGTWSRNGRLAPPRVADRANQRLRAIAGLTSTADAASHVASRRAGPKGPALFR